MATQYAFGKIVTNGLILTVDANDKNSYLGSGTTWFDLSGRGSDGTVVGSPLYVSSQISYFDFTSNVTGGAGTGQYIDFSSTAIPNSGSFTLEAWINRNASAIALGDRESIFSNAGGADGFRFQVGAVDYLWYLIGGVGGDGYSEGSVGSGYAVADGNWHQTILVFDRAAQLGSYSVYAYTDGIFRASGSISSGNQAFTQQRPGVSLGCCSNYKGKISRLLAYSKALSASEVAQNFNAQRSRFGL